MENYTIETDVLFFDAETTGLIAKGLDWKTDFAQFPNVVSLSWIYQGVEKDFIIKPNGWEIPDEAAAIHGITTEYALEHGTPFESVAAEFADDILKAAFVAAHNIYFDSTMIKSNILKHLGQEFYDEYRVEEGLYKGKRIDTMMKTIKFVAAPYPNGRGGNKFPTLGELYNKLFPGETFDAHKSLADCRALKRCLPELITAGIIELKIKQYPGEQIELETKTKPNGNKKIDFDDSQPVIVPGANGENIPESENVFKSEDIAPGAVQSADGSVIDKPEFGLKATEIKGSTNPLLDFEDF